MPLNNTTPPGPRGLALKAYVQFTGAGVNGACTIVKNSNVTSVSRTATGTYTVTFTSNLLTSTYLVIGRADNGSAGKGLATFAAGTRAVGSCSVVMRDGSASTVDPDGTCHLEFWE